MRLKLKDFVYRGVVAAGIGLFMGWLGIGAIVAAVDEFRNPTTDGVDWPGVIACALFGVLFAVEAGQILWREVLRHAFESKDRRSSRSRVGQTATNPAANAAAHGDGAVSPYSGQ